MTSAVAMKPRAEQIKPIAEVFALSSEIINPMANRLPLPPDEGRQVFKDTSPRARRYRAEHWVLKVPDAEVRRVIAFYYPQRRILVRKVGSQHLYGNRPGIAWNLELICRADHFPRRPTALVCDPTELRLDGKPRKAYRLPWEVVRAFTFAALEGDERYLLNVDVDAQVLFPWPAWAGAWTAPPIPEPDPPEQTSLFDQPEDPKPHTFKHAV